MNRAQRRNKTRPKSTSRKVGLTYLTAAGVVTGTLGLASPAHALVSYAPTNCSDLRRDLYLMQSTGGTLTVGLTKNCEIPGSYIFQQGTTIIGPTDRSITLSFTGENSPSPGDNMGDGFTAQSNLDISNLNFTRPANNPGSFDYFVFGWSAPVVISNSTFSNTELSAAIYAEGSLTVSDSTFDNLTSFAGGGAITNMSTTNISNSTFSNNVAGGQASAGAVFANGPLRVIDSTFESNQAGDQGGAIISNGGAEIYNSTFVGNSANSAAAVQFSEGAFITNSTFWNNGDADTYSMALIGNSETFLFANILANDASNVKFINPIEPHADLGANLFTGSGFDDNTDGEGSSKRVTPSELKLSALTLNQSAPTNSGQTKTVAIGAGSIAENYYTENSTGAEEGVALQSIREKDQRGVDRPFGAGYDVGAFEIGVTADPAPSKTPESNEIADSESLADTGIETTTNFLGLIGVGLAAILGGSVGLVRRRRKV